MDKTQKTTKTKKDKKSNNNNYYLCSLHECGVYVSVTPAATYRVTVADRANTAMCFPFGQTNVGEQGRRTDTAGALTSD